jgi:hypothetical protein
MKIRKLAVPYTTIFISQLPEETQEIIKGDLQHHAKKNGIILEKDENNEYIGLSGRFCDIEEIYSGVKLDFCEQGEDVKAYKEEQKRNGKSR